MDDEVRDLLTRYLPPAEPPMPACDLGAGRRARRRNQVVRGVAAVTVVATLTAGVVLAVGLVRAPERPTAAATPAQVFAQLDRTWRSLIPDPLVHVRDSTDETTPPERGFAGYYRLPAPAERTQVNYFVTRGASAPHCPPDSSELRCSLRPQPDGSTVMLQEQSYPGNHLVLRGVTHYRADGVLVSAGLFVPGEHLAGVRFPYTLAQLTTATTDPRMTFDADVVIPSPPPTPSPVHTAPTPGAPVPAADLPILPPQPNCRDRRLDPALGAAAGRALAATVAELIGPDQVQPEPGYAQQGCLPVGAYREVTGAVTAGSIHIDVDVRVTAYAAAVPTTKADACTPTPISCDLSPLPGGRSLARYELTDNLHVDLWYSPHVVVALVALPAGNGYGFSPAEWRAIVSDPRLVAVARQVATA